MDQLTANLGQLSTTAREWTPGGGATATGGNTNTGGSAPNSPLRPAMPGPSATANEWQPLPQAQNVGGAAGGLQGLGKTRGGGGGGLMLGHSGAAAGHGGRAVSADSAGVGGGGAAKEFVPGVGLRSASEGDGIREFVPGVGMTTGEVSQQQQQQQEMAANTATAGPTTTGAPPPPATSLSSARTLHSLGLPEDLWAHYRDLDMESSRQMDPTDPRHRAVPPGYVGAYPLDLDEQRDPGISNKKRSTFGYPTMCFRVTSQDDGRLYCLRRMDSVRCVSPKIAASVKEVWVSAVDPSLSGNSRNSSAAANAAAGIPPPRLVDHPNMVRFYKAFVSQRAVFFVHRYHPGARTLLERYLQGGVPLPLPEDLLWSIVTQLVGVVKAVHGSNLAVRTLQMNHILCTTEAGIGAVGAASSPVGGRVRIRVNCIGIPDALEFEARKPLADLQREDMFSLGRVIMSLATGTEILPADITNNQTMAQCEQYISGQYSRSLLSLIMNLVRPRNMTNDPPTIFDVAGMVAQRAFDELSAAQIAVDKVDESLANEYEAGRALRLLLKLGFINERPEFGVDSRWSETGDNYVLKLFRDFVFHQADGNGRPVMDLGHVVTALNKLDAADDEKIVLVSRDGRNVLVVSYADVARCLENAYGELCDGSVPPASIRAPPMGGGSRGY